MKRRACRAIAARRVLDALRPLLADPAKKQARPARQVRPARAARHGVDVHGYADDTMLESFVLNAGIARHDMDSLAQRHLGYQTVKYEDVAGKGAKQIGFAQVALDDATRYAAEDADITLRLHRAMLPKLQAEPACCRVPRHRDAAGAGAGTGRANGVMVDADELRRQSADLSRRMLAAQQKATELAGRSFNLDSPKQLRRAAVRRTQAAGAGEDARPAQPSTNEEALEAIADQHELPRMILEYRGLAKLRSTYTDKLPEMVNPDTGRVHTSYHQAGAATGRLSSTDPNLQNIPIRTRTAAHPHRLRRAAGRKLMACDYSQIELRIMAHLSAIRPGARVRIGADIHRATAAEVFGKPLEDVSGNERRGARRSTSA
jgi:DNA polymerase-1